MKKPYKYPKKGAGRHVQLLEWFQACQAWATLRPGPRALYVEIKRRYNGNNNGNIVLSHRDAAKSLNVNRNTVGPWFKLLQARGFIKMTQGPHLGPSGIGRSSTWAITEMPTLDSKPATMEFKSWKI